MQNAAQIDELAERLNREPETYYRLTYDGPRQSGSSEQTAKVLARNPELHVLQYEQRCAQ